MKAPSPLLGFNNNVKHKGKVFHIQTEDSGVRHPHVITHLFVDGGRILKSTKTSYAEFLGDEQLTAKVRQLMQEQHKAMFIALRAGKFDHLMDGADAPASSQARPDARPAAAARPVDGSAPSRDRDAPPVSESPVSTGPVSTGPISASPASSAPVTERAGAPRSAPSGTPSVRPTPASSMPRPPSLQPPPPRPSHPHPHGDRAASDRRVDPRAETVAAMPADSRPRLASPALELNLEALERSSGEVKPSSVTGGDLAHLPPPPAAVLGRRAQTFNTGYRSIQTDARAEPTRADAAPRAEPPPSPGRTPTPATATPQRPRSVSTPIAARVPGPERRSITPSGARYAPSRPASIFGSARPQEGSSIFGEDLISEKSLDEVILSYLAEDLDGSKPKR